MPISDSGGDINFGVRITADNQVFVDGVRASNEEVKKLGEGLKRVAGDAGEAARGQDNLTGSIIKGNVASDLAMKAFDKLVQTYADMKEQTRQAQQESLRLESVLRATHEAAGRTAAQITELANAMAKVTKFDDDKVKQAAAQLASFGDIVGQTFDRTIRLAADMSAVFGGDLTSNTQRLAKALTEPGESLGQLERSFGRFDPEVKRAIKNALEMNDVMKAQDIILDAVASRVEGAAENSYRGLERQIQGTKNAWDNFLKALGTEIFDAKSKDASIFETALVHLAETFTSRISTMKQVWKDFTDFLRGYRLEDLPGNTPVPPPEQPAAIDPNRQRAADEFQRLLEGSSKAEKFASEWRHAWATIIQDGKAGTAEAEQILAGIVAKFTQAPKAVKGADSRDEMRSYMEAERYQKAIDDAYSDQILKLTDIVEKSKLEVELLGKSSVERRTQVEILKLEQEVREKIAKAEADGKPFSEGQKRTMMEQLKVAKDQLTEQGRITEETRLTAEVTKQWYEEALRVYQEQQRTQAAVADDLASRVANVAMGISKWRDELRSFVRELGAIVMKRWVLQMIAGVTGSAGVAAQAASIGQGTLAGAGGNWLSNAAGSAASWAGDTVAGWAGYSAMGGFGEAAAGYTAQAAFLSGAAESAPVLGTIAGEIGAAIAAIPVWGWIVAAITAVAIAIGGRGGGPKTGGSFNGAFDAQGNFIGDVAVAGSDNGRFFTPNQADSALATLGKQTGSGYYQMLDRFHGSSAGVQFGLGFDQDPNGTAGARISSSVVIGGRKVFGSQDRGVDKDPEKFNAELAVESKRMILAALQSSDLPAAVEAIISTVSAATATSEQIDQVLQLADAFTVLSDALGEFDMGKVIAQASRSSKQIFADQGKALSDLASKSTLTTASLQTLTAATAQYKEMAAQLILGLEQAKQSIGDMFGQTSRNIKLAGLDGQGQYNFYQSEADRLFSQIGTSTSAEEIQRLSSQINQDYNAAFNLLSPEQQKTMGDEYLKRIDSVNKTIQDRLTKLQEDANKEAKDKLDEIKKVIDKLATDQQVAANTQLEAAQLNAVTFRSGARFEIVDSRGNTLAIVNGG